MYLYIYIYNYIYIYLYIHIYIFIYFHKFVTSGGSLNQLSRWKRGQVEEHVLKRLANRALAPP